MSVLYVNTGRGGLRRWFTTVTARARSLGATVVAVSEALPTAQGLHSAACPEWLWVTQPDCSPAAAAGPQAQGLSESGGVVLLVHNTLMSSPHVSLHSVTPVRTPAAHTGDVCFALVQFAAGATRWGVYVACCYLLPSSSTSVTGARTACGADDSCTDTLCTKQHAIASLNTLLAGVAEPTRCGATCVVGGDLNCHVVGPTAARRRAPGAPPNDKARVHAVSALLRSHDVVIVNDFRRGERPHGASEDDVAPTRLPHSGTDAPATLDLVIAPRTQAGRIHSCTVCPWPPQHAHRDLDHAAVLVTVTPSCFAGRQYIASPGAADIPTRRASRTVVFRRLPQQHPDWAAVTQAAADWVSAAHGAANTPTSAPYIDTDAAATLTAWESVATDASLRAGVAATRSNRHQHRDGGDSLDGRVAATARQLTKLRRRVASLQHCHAHIPADLLSALADARAASHAALDARRYFSADAAAAANRHTMGAHHFDADGHRVLPLGVVCDTRAARTRAPAAKSAMPRYLNGATTHQQAVQEWVTCLRAVDDARKRMGQDVDPAIAARFTFLRDNRHTYSSASNWPAPGADALNSPFTQAELRDAVGHASAGTGVTGVPFGAFKALVTHFDAAAGVQDGDLPQGVAAVFPHNPFLALLTSFANTFLSGAPLPDSLFTLNLRPVHKPGAEPGAFTSFRLLCPGRSVLWIILYAVSERLNNHLESTVTARLRATAAAVAADVHTLPDVQCGFRRGRGTLEALLLAEEATAVANSGANVVANLYFDVANAFDAVRRDAVGVALDAHGVRGAMWACLMSLLDRFSLRVCSGGVEAVQPHRQSTGVFQGSPVSPALFAVTLSSLHRDIAAAVGPAAPLRLPPLTSEDMATFTSIFYADDLAAFAQHEDWPHLHPVLQRVCDDVSRRLRAMGMQLNVRPDGKKTCLTLSIGRGRGTAFDAKVAAVWEAAAAQPLYIDGVAVPVLPPDGVYTYLGLPRCAQPTTVARNGALAVTRGTTRHAKAIGFPRQSQAVRGRVVASGLNALPLRTAVTAYRALLLPSLRYALGVWCTAPSFLPADAAKHHKANLITLCGRGPQTAAPTPCVEAALGLLPPWALPMLDQATVIARVLALHPAHFVRTCLRTCHVRLTSRFTSCGPSWWTAVVSNWNNAPADDVCFRYVVDDLCNTDTPCAAATHVWPTPSRAASADVDVRTASFLRQCVLDTVQRSRLWYWRCDNATKPPTRFCVATRSSHSGSSFVEVRRWLQWSVAGVAFPLVDGDRDDALVARLHALGGVGCVVDGRNLQHVRGRACVVCGKDNTTTTLTHLVAECTDPTLTSHRNAAYGTAQDALTALAADNGDGPSDWCMALDAHPALMSLQQQQDWVSIVFGVPLQRAPVTAWETQWYSDTPPSAPAFARRFRRGLLTATGPLAAAAVAALREGVWNLRRVHGVTDVVLPTDVLQEHERQRRRAQQPTVAQLFARHVRVQRPVLQPGNGDGVGAAAGAGGQGAVHGDVGRGQGR